MATARRLAALLLIALLTVAPGAQPQSAAPTARATPGSSATPSARAARVTLETGTWAEARLRAMTLEEKVSQLFIAPAYGTYKSADDPDYEELIRLVEHFGIGGIIAFQGTPMTQAVLLNDLQRRAEVPLLVSQDMEWGAGMRVEGATSFPRAMAVGATRNEAYARAIGYATAREARALGVQQVYAPVADVNNNPQNPIINVRSFGEAPELVAHMAAAAVRGLRAGGALATVKHFPGHGDTNVDSHIGLPSLPFTRARLDTLELVPFRAALVAGAPSVMTAHLALPRLTDERGVPASLSPRVSRGILRDDLNFDGLIVTDALNMGGVTEHFGSGEIAVRALEAGADVLLMSEDPYAARAAILRAIEQGRLTEARIDRSVRRLLRAKAWAGHDQRRLVDLDALRHHVGTRPHQALAEAVARDALTLLRNENAALPIFADSLRLLSIALTDDADAQSGAAFVDQLRQYHPAARVEQLALDPDMPAADYRAARRAADAADVLLVPAFISVRAWSGRINLPERHRAFLGALAETGKPVVLVAFGNPYLARGLEPQPDAYLAAYGSAPRTQRAAADALLGRSAISGTLPVTIPGTYAYGEGIHLPQIAPRHGLAETVGLSSRRLDRIDSLMRASIDEGAFPGAALAVGRGGAIVKQKGYGYYTYEAEQPVTPHVRYDLASLTKVVATTTAVMQLYEEGLLDLDAPVARYVPAFAQNGKGGITIRHLLTHSSGLIPFRRFHRMPGIETRQDVLDAVLAEELQYPPGTQTAYSDLGFITLMLVVEAVSRMDFAAYAEQRIFEPLGMDDTGFRPVAPMTPARAGVGARATPARAEVPLAPASAVVPDSLIVPTEIDRTFRERLVQGAVHDEAAYLMGGVSGHAGLFSTARDLATFAYMLAHEGRIYGKPFLLPETVRLFTTRVDDLGEDESTRALGWDTKSMEGYSSAGQHFGPNSFGHTGFTGTSLWIDPDQQLFAILLTNRVHPTRENSKLSAVRPRLADIAHTAIQGPPEPLLPHADRAEALSAGDAPLDSEARPADDDGT